ncbi:MAG: hypothetical protein E7441_06605 [Ruminococcaceae bacterium]|nr:hypothetical protein [Oscillospiraceae bacterium]
MKKIISILICMCLIGSLPVFALGDNADDDNIYEAVKFDYCYLTGLSEIESDEIFEEIQSSDIFEIKQYVENAYAGIEVGDFEHNLLFLQDNYEVIVENLSGESKHKLDSYILYITLQYYKDSYTELAKRGYQESIINNNIVPVNESLINPERIENEPAPAFEGYVTMRVFSDPNGTIGVSGHAINTGAHSWIVVYNNSGGNITVGRMSISTGTQIAIGTWGNQYINDVNVLHKGVWYNLEPYMAKYEDAYSDNVSKSCELTESDLAALNNYINSHDTWSATNNCSSFAVGAWNTVVGWNQLSAGIINTPRNLANSIINTTVYTDDLTMRYFYRVHYSNGSSTPIMSTRFTRTD